MEGPEIAYDLIRRIEELESQVAALKSRSKIYGTSNLFGGNSANGTTMRAPLGFNIPFDPSEFAYANDVEITSNTTYSTHAERVQVANNFIISGSATLTAKEGLLIFCKTFDINAPDGVLTAAGSAGGNASGLTAGTGGTGTIGSSGGNGGAGRNTTGTGNAGSAPSTLSIATHVPNLVQGPAASVERQMLGSTLYDSGGFALHGVWGIGGRGGGGGGGGGGGLETGGAGATGGNADDPTAWLNSTGGASGAGGVASNPGANGSAASIITLETGFANLFGVLIPMWYFGAGSGGGGGGGGAESSTAGSGGGGGGGAGGNPILIVCDTFHNSGTITTAGGAGGAGVGNANFGSSGEGGGGGGGGAGALIVICRSLSSMGTLNSAGGAGGSGGNQNSSSLNGGNGAAGTASSLGSTGLLIRAR